MPGVLNRLHSDALLCHDPANVPLQYHPLILPTGIGRRQAASLNYWTDSNISSPLLSAPYGQKSSKITSFLGEERRAKKGELKTAFGEEEDKKKIEEKEEALKTKEEDLKKVDDECKKCKEAIDAKDKAKRELVAAKGSAGVKSAGRKVGKAGSWLKGKVSGGGDKK
eukprot:gnl/TRDRNA2_/TRDRNA2_191161_c0_seq1.p1 gnl/TRDRNA2_/TRDRNA2_191161_c0~~gnl/TRDRNA2_/TRDRNA2_191161_c0_seq1.p1  ORF type:complete len:167 (+),score=40.27 gnl/TRDRNA2_/TRDRNA2_191161_c0_seq1:50-550(+)